MLAQLSSSPPPPPRIARRPVFDVKLVVNGHGPQFITCYPSPEPRLTDASWPTFCHTSKRYNRLSDIENKA